MPFPAAADRAATPGRRSTAAANILQPLAAPSLPFLCCPCLHAGSFPRKPLFTSRTPPASSAPPHSHPSPPALHAVPAARAHLLLLVAVLLILVLVRPPLPHQRLCSPQVARRPRRQLATVQGQHLPGLVRGQRAQPEAVGVGLDDGRQEQVAGGPAGRQRTAQQGRGCWFCWFSACSNRERTQTQTRKGGRSQVDGEPSCGPAHARWVAMPGDATQMPGEWPGC